MQSLGQSGAFTIPDAALAAIRADFTAGTADAAQTKAEIARTHRESGYVLDPHTAVGVSVARRLADDTAPLVTLATAHPAKFPEAVRDATGIEPQLPSWLAGLMDKPERYTVLPNDQGAVEAHVRDYRRTEEFL
jgi:threonine synthase